MMEIKLRPIEEEDLEILKHWRNDPTIKENCNEWRDLNAQDQWVWFDSLTKNINCQMWAIEIEDKKKYRFSMEKEPTIIGACGIVKINWKNLYGEISIYIGDKNYQGLGLGAKTLSLMEKWAWEDAGLRKLLGFVWEGNEKAANMFKSTGYRKVGYFSKHIWKKGKWTDVSIYEKILGGAC